ncbi:MAG: hypothetical protein R3C58_11890 [Parvularculaceae bacterium]
MKSKDLRKEQIALLRFEKALANAAQEKAAGKPLNKGPVLAGLAATLATATALAEKLGTDAPLRYAAELKSAATMQASAESWLMNLAEVAGKAHNAIETLALQGSFVILQATGGTPKEPPREVVASLLMNGHL